MENGDSNNGHGSGNENANVNESHETPTTTTPSDEAIKDAIFQWLDGVDVSVVTKKDLKNQLETLHGWNLNDKKTLLSNSLMEYYEAKLTKNNLEGENANADGDGAGEDGDGDENGEEIIDNEDEKEDDVDNHTNEDEDENILGKKKRKKTTNRAFQTPVQLSTKLSDFFNGEIVMRRPEVTQRMWNYIKSHNLQNPKNRREILCDEKLETLFGRKKIDMFRMTKVLSQNMKSVAELQSGLGSASAVADDDDEDDDEEEEKEVKKKGKKNEKKVKKTKTSSTTTSEKKIEKNNKKKKEAKEEKEEKEDEEEREEEEEEEEEEEGEEEEGRPNKKRRITKLDKQINAREHLRREASQKKIKEVKQSKKISKKAVKTDQNQEKKPSALHKPVELSGELSEFLGFHVMPRTEVVKLVWKYIKEHNLQDPDNKRIIICDEKMETLFNKKQFTMFEMNKYLSEMMSATSLPSDYSPSSQE